MQPSIFKQLLRVTPGSTKINFATRSNHNYYLGVNRAAVAEKVKNVFAVNLLEY